jgi:hypothetical protein
MIQPQLGRDEIMFVVDLERFKALCALYFLNTIQPEELEELKTALNSGETELRKIFNETKKSVKESPISSRFIDTYIDDNESYVKESKLKDVWTYSFVRLFLSYWFSKIKIKLVLAISFFMFLSLLVLTYYTSQLAKAGREMKEELTFQNFELNQKEEMLSVMQLKDVVFIPLNGQSIDPEGYGKIFWSPSAQKAVLQVADLPPVGKGMVYQLWLMNNGTYTNKGTVRFKNNESDNMINIGNLPILKGETNYSFLLTLEKEGNDTKPAGVVYLMSKTGK